MRAAARRDGDASSPDLVPCVCATIRRASRAVTQLYDQSLRAHGLEAPQFALLTLLERMGETSQADMGRRFDLDKTTVSRNLRLLKQRGWIETVAGADGRERRIALTAAGRRQLAAARPTWKKAQAQLRSALGEHDWHVAFQLLNAIAAAARRTRLR